MDEPGEAGVENGDAVGGENQVDVGSKRRRERLPAASHRSSHLHLVPGLPTCRGSSAGAVPGLELSVIV